MLIKNIGAEYLKLKNNCAQWIAIIETILKNVAYVNMIWY